MTKDELAQIVAELDADLKKSAVEVEEALKKALPPKPAPEASDSANPADDAAAASPAPAPEASESKTPEASEPAPESPSESAESPAEAGTEGQDPAADAQLTPEALQAEYSQLSPEELDMHLQAALAAKEALAGAASPAPTPAPAPAAAPAPEMAAKEELGKAEKSIAALTELEKSQQEDIEILAKTVRFAIETPVRKAVTSLSDIQPQPQHLNKSEKQMTNKDVHEFIKENAHKMSKSERDLWLQFVDKKVPAAKLAPMLERLSSNSSK